MKRIRFVPGVCVAVGAALSSACAVLGSGGTGAAAPVSLAGNWILNEAESSDTARASLRGLERGMRAEPAASGSAARPAGTYADRLRTARVEGELAMRVLAAARNHIEQVAIADSAGIITLRSGERGSVVLTPDGSSKRQQWLDGTSGELRARWVEQRLEIVRRLEGGITVQEYYSRSPGGSRLVVFTIVTGPFDGEITLRRVYELVG